MKRILAVVPCAVLFLAGCGDSCTSTPADVQQLPATCTLPAGVSATIDVQLCAKCTDSTPLCQAEFLNNEFELAPTLQQCQANAGCGITNACDIDNSRVSCTVTTPTTPGSYTIVTANQVRGTVQVTSGGTVSCSL
jgi:hypothetical protein